MRTHYCGQVDERLAGETVSVAGWVHRRRDHGGVIFVDLRDREGLLQVVFDPDLQAMFAEAEKLRNEFVVRVTGRVRERPAGTHNANLRSGKVELLAQELELLNRSEPLPFQLDEQASEEVRLRYRYLDLRREVMSQRLRQRHQITRAMRHYLDDAGFIDIETPMLTKATPEGARDYLVPSRTHPGKFFALPQSPQIFKQLLMVSGFDRYYQIVRCFRDEDLRADRQPEFTQLDIETSFLTQEQIMVAMEGLIRHIFKVVADVALPDPFPRMTYAEAMRRYASDKPDLRVPLELVDVADLVADCDFKVFAGPAKDPNGRVAALRVPGGGKLTRKEIDDYTAFVARYGARGLAYVKVNEVARGRDGLQSPIIKFLSRRGGGGHPAAHGRGRRRPGVLRRRQRAGRQRRARRAAAEGRQRPGAARRPGWRPLWVVDFPMFEFDPEEKRWAAMHHPFTSPKDLDPEALRARPGRRAGQGLRLVLNGSEIGGGSVRIFQQELQSTVFDLLGIDARGGAAQVRLPARCAEVRRAAARRHRVRPGPPRDADLGRGQHPRRDRLPEDADGGLPADGCADGRQREAAARASHPRPPARTGARRELNRAHRRRLVGHLQFLGIVDPPGQRAAVALRLAGASIAGIVFSMARPSCSNQRRSQPRPQLAATRPPAISRGIRSRALRRGRGQFQHVQLDEVVDRRGGRPGGSGRVRGRCRRCRGRGVRATTPSTRSRAWVRANLAVAPQRRRARRACSCISEWNQATEALRRGVSVLEELEQGCAVGACDETILGRRMSAC